MTVWSALLHLLTITYSLIMTYTGITVKSLEHYIKRVKCIFRLGYIVNTKNYPGFRLTQMCNVSRLRNITTTYNQNQIIQLKSLYHNYQYYFFTNNIRPSQKSYQLSKRWLRRIQFLILCDLVYIFQFLIGTTSTVSYIVYSTSIEIISKHT